MLDKAREKVKNWWRNRRSYRLSKEEEHSLAVLATLDPESEDYRRVLENVEKTHSLRRKPFRVSPDTLFTGLISIGSIVAILKAEERGYLLTTKAANYIPKPKF